MEGLHALADAAGGALAAADQPPATLPTPTSAVSTYADDEGSICNVGEVADIEGFIVRAVALAPEGAPKLLSDAGLGDVLLFSIEKPSWFPAGSSGSTRMLNELALQGVIVRMRPIAKSFDYILRAAFRRHLLRARRRWAEEARRGARHCPAADAAGRRWRVAGGTAAQEAKAELRAAVAAWRRTQGAPRRAESGGMLGVRGCVSDDVHAQQDLVPAEREQPRGQRGSRLAGCSATWARQLPHRRIRHVKALGESRHAGAGHRARDERHGAGIARWLTRERTR